MDPLGLCSFNVGISTNNKLNAQQLQPMKDEITQIFGTAGQQINFVSQHADYWLNINPHGAAYTNNPTAVGITYLSGLTVTNNGRVFVDRLTPSAIINAPSATAFSQNSNAVAVGLGRAGSHEIGHYLLQQNFDSPTIRGVMHDGFNGGQWFSSATRGLWTFTARQIVAMNKLCAPLSTPTTLPNTTPLIRPLIGGSGEGNGGPMGIVYPSWWYAMVAFLGWIDSIQVEKVTVVVKDVN